MQKRLVEETEKPSKDDHLDSFSVSEDALYPFSSADHEPLILKNDMQLDKPFWMNSFHKQDRHHNLWNGTFSTIVGFFLWVPDFSMCASRLGLSV